MGVATMKIIYINLVIIKIYERPFDGTPPIGFTSRTGIAITRRLYGTGTAYVDFPSHRSNWGVVVEEEAL